MEKFYIGRDASLYMYCLTALSGCEENSLYCLFFFCFIQLLHSGRELARKWKNNVWVIVNGKKVMLCKTVLLKYHNEASKNANGAQRSQNGQASHRDEFVCCARCNKERKFRLQTKQECQIHHDAVM